MQKRVSGDAIVSKILAAGFDLAGGDFYRLDRFDVGGTHVANHRPRSALVESGHFGCGDRAGAILGAKSCASD